MKISLAINSKEPVHQYLLELFKSIEGFDEVLIYFDGPMLEIENIPVIEMPGTARIIGDGSLRDIKGGFNYAVNRAAGEWICSFCDDDFFIKENLVELLSSIRDSRFDEDADIIHFPVMTGSGSWGSSTFNEFELRDCNCLPHGSFFRKELWDKLGGYKTNAGSDWNFWIRAKKAGARFKFWPKPIYFFRMGHARSAWAKQISEFGANEIKRIVNETN